MTGFTKSFLWRFILDIIILGIFVRLLQTVILAILSRSMETYSTPSLLLKQLSYRQSVCCLSAFSHTGISALFQRKVVMTIRWIQINGSEILQLLISDRRWVECQSTTYFMQYLALLAAEGQEHMTIALEEVAPIFKDVKWDFIRYSTVNDVLKGTDYISDPHLQISYYVISRG